MKLFLLKQDACMHVVGWSGFYNFFESARSHPLADAFFNADHDELTEFYILSKNEALACMANYGRGSY